MAFLKLFKKISKLEPGLANVLCGEDIVNTCERRSGGSIRVVMRPGEVVAYIITHNPSWDAPILRCLPHCRRWHGQFRGCMMEKMQKMQKYFHTLSILASCLCRQATR